MKQSDRAYVLGSVFAAATSFAYFCVRHFHVTLPRYYPLENTWKWAKEPGVPSQAWYAIQVLVLICGAAAVLAMHLILKYTKCKETELTAGQSKWLGIAVSGSIVASLTYIVFYEFRHWGIIG